MAGVNWIKVADRLPEAGTSLLCVGTHGGVFLVNRCTEVLEDRIWVNGTGWRKFTHWMQLPATPRGDM